MILETGCFAGSLRTFANLLRMSSDPASPFGEAVLPVLPSLLAASLSDYAKPMQMPRGMRGLPPALPCVAVWAVPAFGDTGRSGCGCLSSLLDFRFAARRVFSFILSFCFKTIPCSSFSCTLVLNNTMTTPLQRFVKHVSFQHVPITENVSNVFDPTCSSGQILQLNFRSFSDLAHRLLGSIRRATRYDYAFGTPFAV